MPDVSAAPSGFFTTIANLGARTARQSAATLKTHGLPTAAYRMVGMGAGQFAYEPFLEKNVGTTDISKVSI